jgi:Peptidase family S51
MIAGPRAVVLLGAQRFDPSLPASVAKRSRKGQIATITAGWQERETEDRELALDLDERTVNLRLYERAEEVFRADPELHAAHRARQETLRHRQDCYRIRLEHAVEAERVIRQRAVPASILEEESEASIESIRELDGWHLAQCARIHREFEQRWKLGKRPAVAKHREEIAELINASDAVAIAGGHVATLVNRLTLFSIATMVKNHVVFAWSGGAMAISDRIVLFHHAPPQGPGTSEVLDVGLGLVPGAVLFPQPENRLRLDRTDLVEHMVRRFSPAQCIALPARATLTWQDGHFSDLDGSLLLQNDGTHVQFDPALRSPSGGPPALASATAITTPARTARA